MSRKRVFIFFSPEIEKFRKLLDKQTIKTISMKRRSFVKLSAASTLAMQFPHIFGAYTSEKTYPNEYSVKQVKRLQYLDLEA